MHPRSFIAIFALLFLPAGLSAQTVDELIQKHIQATGGYEKWKSLKTMKISGTISIHLEGIPIAARLLPRPPGTIGDLQRSSGLR